MPTSPVEVIRTLSVLLVWNVRGYAPTTVTEATSTLPNAGLILISTLPSDDFNLI